MVLMTLVILSFKIFSVETAKRELKTELIELSDIKYGIFNVDQCRAILSEILSKKIDEFEISEKNRKEMRFKIKQLITEGISDFKSGIKDRH